MSTTIATQTLALYAMLIIMMMGVVRMSELAHYAGHHRSKKQYVDFQL